MRLEERIREVINEDEVIQLTRELISIPSHCNVPGREKDIARFIYNWFKNEGIRDVEIIPVLDERPNVIVRLRGKKPGRTIMFNGHMDTVPPYDMVIDPFDPVMKDGKIFGRGSCDMKGPLATMMMAMAALHRADLPEYGEVVLTAVINEEQKSEGTEDIIKRGIKADGAIVGEPTNLTIAAGHRGLEWLRVTIQGRATHGGSPEKGVNAISKASDFIHEIETHLIPRLAERSHPLVGTPLLNMGVIHGGDQPSTVAGECIIDFDRRWTPNETLEQVFEDIYDVFERLKERDPSFNASLARIPDNMATMDHKPVVIDLNHPLLLSLSVIAEEILGRQVEIGTLGGWTDASLLSNFGHIPSLNFGPGKMENAHSAVEYIETEQLLPATNIYTTMACIYTKTE